MPWFPKNSVVVPVDFSDESWAALGVGIDLAKEPKGVHVVHILHEISSVEPGEVWMTIDHESRRKNTEESLQKRLAEENAAEVTIHVSVGDPGHEIAEYAKQIGADLIIMPSHGRSGLKRLLLGSVAERTLRLAHCPVLVLRS